MTEDNELIKLREAIARQRAEVMWNARTHSWNSRFTRGAYRNHEVEL